MKSTTEQRLRGVFLSTIHNSKEFSFLKELLSQEEMYQLAQKFISELDNEKSLHVTLKHPR